MKVKVFNEHNLKDSDMSETITRVKAFIMNENQEVLTAISAGSIQLIGGHVEEGEEMLEALKREVQEETGMVVTNTEISQPFFEVSHYTYNYHNLNYNRMSNVFYYTIKTDQSPNTSNLNLTEKEKAGNFSLKWIKLSEFEKVLEEYMQSDIEVSRKIAKELLIAFKELP